MNDSATSTHQAQLRRDQHRSPPPILILFYYYCFSVFRRRSYCPPFWGHGPTMSHCGLGLCAILPTGCLKQQTKRVYRRVPLYQYAWIDLSGPIMLFLPSLRRRRQSSFRADNLCNLESHQNPNRICLWSCQGAQGGKHRDALLVPFVVTARSAVSPLTAPTTMAVAFTTRKTHLSPLSSVVRSPCEATSASLYPPQLGHAVSVNRDACVRVGRLDFG